LEILQSNGAVILAGAESQSFEELRGASGGSEAFIPLKARSWQTQKKKRAPIGSRQWGKHRRMGFLTDSVRSKSKERGALSPKGKRRGNKSIHLLSLNGANHGANGGKPQKDYENTRLSGRKGGVPFGRAR